MPKPHPIRALDVGPLYVGRQVLMPVWKPLVRLGNWVDGVEVPNTDLSAADSSRPFS